MSVTTTGTPIVPPTMEETVAALQTIVQSLASYISGIPSDGPVCNAAFNVERMRGLLLLAASGRAIVDFGDRRTLAVFADQLPALLQRAGDTSSVT